MLNALLCDEDKRTKPSYFSSYKCQVKNAGFGCLFYTDIDITLHRHHDKHNNLQYT